MNPRYVIVGVAGARSRWFSDLTRWTTSGLVPADYIKALSIDEVRAILGTGRPASAVLIAATTTGLDREFVAFARSTGVAVIVVSSENPLRDWDSLGVAGVLPADFTPEHLGEALTRHARPLDPSVRRSSMISVQMEPAHLLSPVIAVTGIGGAGSSTIAMCLSQGLAALETERPQCDRGSESGPSGVALIDLSCSADLAMYHDVGDIVPGFPELVDSHRGDTPDPDSVRGLLYPIRERGYSLLLGVRRSSDKMAMGPLSTAAAIDGVRRSYATVVVDMDPAVEGEADTGSIDIETYNAASRHVAMTAEIILVVTNPGMRGMKRLTSICTQLRDLGVPAERLLPVVNHAPQRAAGRAAISRSVAEVTGSRARAVQPPLFIARHRLMEDIQRCASVMPQHSSMRLANTSAALIARLGDRPHDEPERLPRIHTYSAGSLGVA